MTRIALAALCVLLSAPAWGQTYGPYNPGMIMCDPPIHWPSGMIPTGGHLVETPQGIAVGDPNPVAKPPALSITCEYTTGRDTVTMQMAGEPPLSCPDFHLKGSAHQQRAYTLDDIDRMRTAVRKAMALKPPPCPGGMITTCYDGVWQPPASEVEDELRTYMTAGISPEELEKKAANK